MSEATAISPEQWELALEWLARADGDVRIAEVLLLETPDLVWGAAFHCQQALEKLAKAVLIAMCTEPPKTHDIEVLSRLVGSLRPELGERVGALARLTVWYIGPRYPNAGIDSVPEEAEVRASLGQLRELRAEIAALAPKRGE